MTWAESEPTAHSHLSLAPTGIVTVRGTGDIGVLVKLTKHPHVMTYGRSVFISYLFNFKNNFNNNKKSCNQYYVYKKHNYVCTTTTSQVLHMNYQVSLEYIKSLLMST